MLDTPSTVTVGSTSTSIAVPSFSERIVDAAATILGRGRHADYTIDTIMEVAKVGVSTLYSRFPGKKDAITEALMHREMTMVLSHASHGGEPPWGEENLRLVVEAMVERALERPVMTRLLNIEWNRIRSWKPGEPDYVTSGVQGCLAWATEPERARAERAASEVVALIRSMTDAACANGERDAAALTERLTGTVMCYLRHFA